MLVGIFFSALGVSFSIKSQLGATPVGVCPAVLSPFLKISTGMGTAILLGLFFIAQIIILKKKFRPIELTQLAATVIYGFFLDLATAFISALPSESLWQRILCSGLGIFFLAFGVFITLKVNLVMLPQDALVNVISKRYSVEYGKLKIAFDSGLTILAAVASLVIYQKLVQVGVSTIVAAIFVGKIISKLKKLKGINLLLDRAMGNTRKDTQHGSPENHILAASKNEQSSQRQADEDRTFQRPNKVT